MYYPKSKVTENQYTSGGQFVIASTGKSYEGIYHITYDQNYYTGATHTNSSQLLTKASPSTSYIAASSGVSTVSGSNLIQPGLIANFEYDSITGGKFSFLKQEIIPVAYYPVLTAQNYATGVFTRYFAKRTGGSARDIKELSTDGFSDLTSNVLYLSTSLQWKLTGPMHDQIIDFNNTVYGVYDTNARSVAGAESSLPGITQYLGNLVELAKFI